MSAVMVTPSFEGNFTLRAVWAETSNVVKRKLKPRSNTAVLIMLQNNTGVWFIAKGIPILQNGFQQKAPFEINEQGFSIVCF